MMQDPVMLLLRDRFDKVDRDNAEIVRALREHTDKDEVYWKRSDEQAAQLSLMKKLFSGASATGVITYLYQKFLGH